MTMDSEYIAPKKTFKSIFLPLFMGLIAIVFWLLVMYGFCVLGSFFSKLPPHIFFPILAGTFLIAMAIIIPKWCKAVADDKDLEKRQSLPQNQKSC